MTLATAQKTAERAAAEASSSENQALQLLAQAVAELARSLDARLKQIEAAISQPPRY
jgi:hypothetical protein